MSNIAQPVPTLLKEVKHGKGQYAKRLENNRRLLLWALRYVQTNTDDLYQCHVDPQGNINDAEAKLEIRRCRKWCALVRSFASAKESDAKR